MTATPSPTPTRNGSSLAKMLLVALVASGFPIGGVIVWLTWWSAASWAGVVLMAFSPSAATILARRLFPMPAMRPAAKRYNRRVGVTMVAYVALLMAAISLDGAGYTNGPLGYLIALAPALPIMACFVFMAQFIKEETDEFLRSVMTSAMFWAGGLTLGECTAWGFLETFDLVPNIWMWAVPIAFFVQYGLASPLVARRYR